MSHLITALKRGTPLEDIIRDLHLEASYGVNELADLVQLNYSQTESPTDDPIACECRGLIVDRVNNTIVANVFPRFFNHGQKEAAILEWDTARVQTKYDGSLGILYHYNDKWYLATRGSIEASGPVNNTNQTFAELFWKIWNKNNYWMDGFENSNTYIFEICSRANKIVVDYPEDFLVLLSVRNTQTGQEQNLDMVSTNVPIVE